MNKKVKKYCSLVIGLLLMAISFNLFQAPYNIASGGVTGLAIIVKKFLPINEALFIFLVNQSLIILSFLVLGKKRTINTILGSLLLPVFIELTSFLPQIPDLDYILIAIIGIINYK